MDAGQVQKPTYLGEDLGDEAGHGLVLFYRCRHLYFLVKYAYVVEHSDPMKKSYFGSEVPISGLRFAHGGSDYVLSRAVMYKLVVILVVIHNGTAAQWDSVIQDEYCGDLMIGRALEEYGTVLQDVWPSNRMLPKSPNISRNR